VSGVRKIRRRVLAGQHPAEPATLDVRDMPDEAEQRYRRRLDGAGGQLGGIQARAFQFERLAVPAQERGERGPFIRTAGWFRPGIIGRIDEHIRESRHSAIFRYRGRSVTWFWADDARGLRLTPGCGSGGVRGRRAPIPTEENSLPERNSAAQTSFPPRGCNPP
jgi:hypothetical protein